MRQWRPNSLNGHDAIKWTATDLSLPSNTIPPGLLQQCRVVWRSGTCYLWATDTIETCSLWGTDTIEAAVNHHKDPILQHLASPYLRHTQKHILRGLKVEINFSTIHSVITLNNSYPTSMLKMYIWMPSGNPKYISRGNTRSASSASSVIQSGLYPFRHVAMIPSSIHVPVFLLYSVLSYAFSVPVCHENPPIE